MDRDILIGCLIIAGALGSLTYLLLWSLRTINRISENGYRSMREIMKDLHDDE